jgi:2-polyprenyl-6-methoxyphenol hydroxylase-like FAD-dependent oxidoreductase
MNRIFSTSVVPTFRHYSKHILVVGRTVEGVCAAIALRRKNYTVDLVDDDRNYGSEGRGLILTPRSLRALDELGVLKPVIGRSHPLNYVTQSTDLGQKMFTQFLNKITLKFGGYPHVTISYGFVSTNIQ